jgi:hypothetical protein
MSFSREDDTRIPSEYTLSEPRAKEERTNDILSIYKRYTTDKQPIYKQAYFIKLFAHIQ